MVKKIDKLDKKIIEILQNDGTINYTDLASQLGVSDATARRRKLRLIDEEIIRVVAVANPFKLDFEIIAIIGISVVKNLIKQVEDAFVHMPHVRFVGVTLGRYDLMIEAWFKSGDEFLHFVTGDLSEIEGIQKTESFQIMRLSKYTYDWGKPDVT